jgi:hypothetical protein
MTTAKLVAATAAATKSEEAIVIPEAVKAMAERIKKEMKVTDTGVIEVPKELYESLLPAGLDMSLIKKLQAHDSEFMAAGALANGELGLKHFAKHKNVDVVTSEIAIGKNSASFSFQRSKPVPDGNGAMQIKHGVSSAKYVVSAAGGNRGALKKVRMLLSSMAESASHS